MGKRILRVYLAKNDTPYSAAYAKLEMPASPWEVWDAMEKVRLQTDDILYMEIEDYYHDNKAIDEKHILLWEQIVRVI